MNGIRATNEEASESASQLPSASTVARVTPSRSVAEQMFEWTLVELTKWTGTVCFADGIPARQVKINTGR